MYKRHTLSSATNFHLIKKSQTSLLSECNNMRYQSLLLAHSALFLAATAASEVYRFPNRPYNGHINEEFESLGGNIDGPKFTPGVNSSLFDWSVLRSFRLICCGC